MQVHRFSNRLKTSLWGNKSKYPRFPIHSTLLLPNTISFPKASCNLRTCEAVFAVKSSSMFTFLFSMFTFSGSLKVPLMCNIRLWRGWFSFNRRLRKNTAVVLVLPSPKTWICHNLEIKTQDGGWFHPSKGSYKRTSSPPKNHSPMSPAAPWRCRRVQSRHLRPIPSSWCCNPWYVRRGNRYR